MTGLFRKRRGLTLVELLVAVAIIGLLAAVLVGVGALAGRTARVARTKSTIAKLHTLLMERYDLYRTRRIELAADAETNLSVSTGINLTALNVRQYKAAARLAAMREMMQVEMPDRWSDVLGVDVPSTPVVVGSARPTLLFLETTPAVWQSYARAYNKLVGATNSVTDATNTREDLIANQGAECLYLTIIHTTGDGEARGQFKDADIGDTDGDGAPEFLDAWGQPIEWLRWAPGFDSDLQLDYDEMTNIADTSAAAARELILEDHDPLDLFYVDQPSTDDNDLQGGNNYVGLRGWRLVPLVFSRGRDEEFGIRRDNDTDNLVANVNPYQQVNGQWLGGFDSDEPDGYADNVHNHQASTLSKTK